MLMKYISPSMSRRRAVSTTIYHVLMLLVSFLMLYPVLWLIASSFKPNGDIFTTATTLIPDVSTLEHYIKGWQGFGGYTFTVFFKNSLFVAILSAIGMTISSALVAFWSGAHPLQGPQRLVRADDHYDDAARSGHDDPPLCPVQQNGLGRQLSADDRTVFLFASGFNIFLIMQFIRGIPRDMDEAAKIDGCSWYGVFFRIIVPLIVPSLVTVGVLTFMCSWEDFMGALLYLNKPATYTVAYALKMFNDSSMSDYGATFAMSTASLVPVLDPLLLLPEEPCRGHLHSGSERLSFPHFNKENLRMFCIDRLPAIPLVASDPYLSIWMPADTMTQTDTCHWSGPAKPIRGVLTVGGAACRFLGEGAEPEAALTELKVTATRTRFVSEFGGVQLETTFCHPALPDDLIC